MIRKSHGLFMFALFWNSHIGCSVPIILLFAVSCTLHFMCPLMPWLEQGCQYFKRNNRTNLGERKVTFVATRFRTHSFKRATRMFRLGPLWSATNFHSWTVSVHANKPVNLIIASIFCACSAWNNGVVSKRFFLTGTFTKAQHNILPAFRSGAGWSVPRYA